MKISDIRVTENGKQATLAARIQPEGRGTDRELSLFFRFTGLDAPPEPAPDAFTVALTPTCMLEREAIRFENMIDRALHAGIEQAQAVLENWYVFLETVTLEEIPAPQAPAAARGPAEAVVCCFSGGVDSWYSLLRNRDRITHLLLVRGFDIGLDNDLLWNRTVAQVQQVADALDLKVILCETNIRAVADTRFKTWGNRYELDFWGLALHGAALSAVAHAASSTVRTLIVPATHDEHQLKPWGSSPHLDHLWSASDLSVVHDGCDRNRVEKLFEISSNAVALTHLRVCHNDTENLNCCRCEKCIRTMISLRLCGALDRAPTFPDPRALARLRRLEIPDHLSHHYLTLLDAARQVNDRHMTSALEVILGRRFSFERSLARTFRTIRHPGMAWRKPQPMMPVSRRGVEHAD